MAYSSHAVGNSHALELLKRLAEARRCYATHTDDLAPELIFSSFISAAKDNRDALPDSIIIRRIRIVLFYTEQYLDILG